MLAIPIPGREALALEHLVCDLNGTLAEDGLLLEGIAGRLVQLSGQLAVHVLSADTHGTLGRVMEQVRNACVSAGVPSPQHERVTTGVEKGDYVEHLGAAQVAAIGNGSNDLAMFRAAALSIAVLGGEGAATQAMLSAHVVARSAPEALDLLLYSERLVATLRP